MKRPSAGDLYYRVGFESPQSGSDGAGGVLDGFEEQFQVRAAYTHLRGGEGIIAARLEGRHAQIITVRFSSQVAAVTRDWRIVDKRNGDTFNIRDISPSKDRAFVDILAEKGVAA